MSKVQNLKGNGKWILLLRIVIEVAMPPDVCGDWKTGRNALEEQLAADAGGSATRCHVYNFGIGRY